MYNQYVHQYGSHPTYEQYSAYLNYYYYPSKYSPVMFQPPPFIPVSMPVSAPVSTPVSTLVSTPVSALVSTLVRDENKENEEWVIDVKPNVEPNVQYKQKIPTNFAFNKKYGTKNKDECVDGMSCKNVYCKYFHHPSADPNIFFNK